MKFSFTIGRRIGTGFTVLILLMIVGFILTQATLNKTRKINDEINKIYTPSVSALEELNLLIVRSKMLIFNWVFHQSSSDNPEKKELKDLISLDYPRLQTKIRDLSIHWKREEKEISEGVFSLITILFDKHLDIIHKLNSFESYEDANIVFVVRPMVNEGEVDAQTKLILKQLSGLIKIQHEHSKRVSKELISSVDLLEKVVQGLGIALVIGGILIAFFTIQSIVKPIHELKTILLSMGRGVLPAEKIKYRNDEIGEMSVALNYLVEGMRSTTEFAKQVGSGNFESDYRPLSEEDPLGDALLKMRTDLAENERLLESKVIERTEEVMRQKVELERQRDELAKLSIVASKTDNMVMIAGVDGTIEYLNERYTQLSGNTLETLRSVGKDSIFHLSFNSKLRSIINEMLKDKRSKIYETLSDTKDGSKIWMQTTVTPILDDEGNVKRLVFIDTDIHERKKAEEEIHTKSLQLQLAYKDITDSIQYAKRIQEAILPPDSVVKALLPGSFFLYKPKDIVSGDFYWVEKKNGKTLFAAVDCTGHGVPGAFMSIVGYNILKHVVFNMDQVQPAKILDHLSVGVYETLHQSAKEVTSRDSMDIALCLLNHETKELQFAGAMNPLYLIRDGKLIEYKGDKFPIGYYIGREDKTYTNNTIQLKKGDMVYIFSDGYADQFGGPHGKKFMVAPFRKLLLRISSMPVEQQKLILDKTIQEWRSTQEQVDDILVMGLRVE